MHGSPFLRLLPSSAIQSKHPSGFILFDSTNSVVKLNTRLCPYSHGFCLFIVVGFGRGIRQVTVARALGRKYSRVEE